jgi:putative SOS response-associated peptidase YedK
MCGRFANQQESAKAWDEYFDCDNSIENIVNEVSIGYNITPTQTIPVVTKDGWLAARWGLIAPWVKDEKDISSRFATFNARIETISEKSTFKSAWNNGRYCVVPAVGYYEWKKEGNSKQPYFIKPTNGCPMFLLGLYEPKREKIPPSCTIITSQSDGELANVHHRVPEFTNNEGIKPWLQNGKRNTTIELMPFPVSKAVNNPINQGSKLIQSL